MKKIYSEDLINIGLIKKGMFSYVYKAKFRKQKNDIVTVKLFKGIYKTALNIRININRHLCS